MKQYKWEVRPVADRFMVTWQGKRIAFGTEEEMMKIAGAHNAALDMFETFMSTLDGLR